MYLHRLMKLQKNLYLLWCVSRGHRSGGQRISHQPGVPRVHLPRVSWAEMLCADTQHHDWFQHAGKNKSAFRFQWQAVRPGFSHASLLLCSAAARVFPAAAIKREPICQRDANKIPEAIMLYTNKFRTSNSDTPQFWNESPRPRILALSIQRGRKSLHSSKFKFNFFFWRVRRTWCIFPFDCCFA